MENVISLLPLQVGPDAPQAKYEKLALQICKKLAPEAAPDAVLWTLGESLEELRSQDDGLEDFPPRRIQVLGDGGNLRLKFGHVCG